MAKNDENIPVKEGGIQGVNIEEEMKSSYIDYAMSVIVGRALPDVRDGFKPVHRRVLYAMWEMGLEYNKAYRKSAKIVGEVMGNYHPHGDASIYDTMVRMAQEWNLRYPLVDGQGNFGSVDGDPPAAMRYTEARLSKISQEVLADIEKDTVEFGPNYDESREEPLVLPVKIPNLLVNGSSGIAVGMATNIPPHNLGEVVDALCALIDDPDSSIEALMKIVKGPDFPTAGFILGKDGIKDAYRTGRGSLTIQAKVEIEEDKRERERIIVTELPYQVNKSSLIETMAGLVRDKKIDGIRDLRDESDRDGMRIVIELAQNAVAQVVLNQLYKHTNMRTSFGVILLALVNNQPRVLNLKGLLHYFIEHRKDVILRRTRFDLAKAERRAHILEGYKIALANLDKVIAIIRKSKNTEEARQGLMTAFKLSEIQATAILELRLQQLTNMEQLKIDEEYLGLIKLIEQLRALLLSEKKLLGLIKEELGAVKAEHGDARRTQIIAKAGEMAVEDLVAEEDVVVTFSHAGYVKRVPASAYKAQKRGGKGVAAMGTREEDFVERLFVASTHDTLLIFTNLGKVFWKRVFEIPEASRAAKGKHLSSLLPIREEGIAAVFVLKDFSGKTSLVMSTKEGLVKKTALQEYSNPRTAGIIAITLTKGDELIGVQMGTDAQDLILASHEGMSIRFPLKEVREIGRTGQGVKGITLEKGDYVVDMEVVKDPKGSLLTICESGYGKRSELAEYRVQGRAGKGLINVKVTDKTGRVVGVKPVTNEDELMLITSGGTMLRMKVSDVNTTGRNTQGVRVIKVGGGDRVVAVAKLASAEEESEE
ncbi:MAG TPA: DNA gyrase subunit A [bacterium]|jgi:DNA gyrase subunit A|nr:DNA gyrase subunit A [bacterium]